VYEPSLPGICTAARAGSDFAIAAREKATLTGLSWIN